MFQLTVSLFKNTGGSPAARHGDEELSGASHVS